MALLTNTTITRTERRLLPDGRTETVTETVIDTERTAAIATVWAEASYRHRWRTAEFEQWIALAGVAVMVALAYLYSLT